MRQLLFHFAGGSFHFRRRNTRLYGTRFIEERLLLHVKKATVIELFLV